MSPASPILLALDLLLAALGILGGWHWWHTAGIILFTLCMFGGVVGKPEVSHPTAIEVRKHMVAKARVAEQYERAYKLMHERNKPFDQRIVINTAPATEAEKEWMRKG